MIEDHIVNSHWRKDYITSCFKDIAKKLKSNRTEMILLKSRQIGKTELQRQLRLHDEAKIKFTT